jgi:glyoxylase-like metal-dependent hydrolase (beta-lactamase superfamily II)
MNKKTATGTSTIDLIDLNQTLPGHRKFISCYLWRSKTLTYIVDPGPCASIKYLIKELSRLGVKHIDYVLLTHIHLDHGGGTAQVLKAFPYAKVYCHPLGIRHISDPSKLWEGSKKVLGEVAHIFGKPDKIPRTYFVTEQELKTYDIQVIMTPGHAAHHVSFVHDKILYAGEALGIRYPLKSKKLYLRPAMPPRFFLDQALKSLDRIFALDPEPEKTAFAHYGLADGCFEYVKKAQGQLRLWVSIVQYLLTQSDDNLKSRFHDELLLKDPLYGQSVFDELEDDIKEREYHYLSNTLEGIKGYLENN